MTTGTGSSRACALGLALTLVLSPLPEVGIGWCHIQLGQKAQARAALRRALRLGPGNKAALEGLRRAS